MHPRRQKLLAGIDLGSTSLKAVIYDLDGRPVSSGSRPTERVHPDADHPDWTVWDPAQIWGGAAAAMKEAASGIADARDVAAVAVTGMGMDGLPVDGEGRWLYPFISWLCPRTRPQLEWWERTIGAAKTFAVGGNTLWTHSTALRLLWMAEHEPAILARTRKWLLIEDFLNFMLCGTQATDYSMASCTLLFDQARRDWSTEMLSLAGIDRSLLCDPLPSATVLGEVTGEAARLTGLAAGTPVVLGGHDYLCGALPVGAHRPGTLLDVTGTWEVVLAALPAPVLTPALQQCGATVECHVARDRWSVMGAAVCAEMLEWYRREFGAEARARAAARGCADWETLMEEASASAVGSGGVMFLPHMSGAGCPVVDPGSRGAFVGLSTLATRGDMLRAVVEGLDFQLLDIVREVGGRAGVPLDRFVVVGGAVRNPFWMQNKADMAGRTVEASETEDASPLGAAMLAGIGVRLYRDEDEAAARVHAPTRTYEPDPARAAAYAGLFPLYRSIYPALAPFSHAVSAGKGRS
jgi:xylulokinase